MASSPAIASPARTRPTDDPLGTRIAGRYRLLRRLGRGGMGEVFMARDERLDREVAIKRVLPVPDSGPGGPSGDDRTHWHRASMVVHEARTMARPGLVDPNVVAVLDYVFDDDDNPCIVMELVRGQNLERWAAGQTRPWSEILEVMLAAGRGLAAAHRAGVLHCDVKPSNVFLDRDESGSAAVKVGDFGLALHSEAFEGSHDHRSALQASMDRSGDSSSPHDSGTLLGTPAFMSPEQAAGDPLDARSDQYSFCMSLHALLYGERPFGTWTTPGVRATTIPDAPASTSVPRSIRGIIRRGLSPDPDDRFASMTELLAALERGRDRPMRRRRFLAWTLTVMACFLGSLLLSSWLGSKAPEGRCVDPGARWHESWGPERRAKLRAAFLGTKVAWAEDSWERVQDRLDTWIASWTRTQATVCAARSVDAQVAKRDALDRQRCLELDAARITALIAEFETADPKLVTRAAGAVASLPRPERCLDVDRLREETPWPNDLETLLAVQSIRSELAACDATVRAGRWIRGRDCLDGVLARAEAVGFDEVLAETHHRLAWVHRQLTDSDRAIEHFEHASFHAVASGYRIGAAAASIELVGEYGYLKGDLDAGLARVPEAVSRLQAAGIPPNLEALFENTRAVLFALRGEHSRAQRSFERAFELWRTGPGPQRVEVTSALSNLGVLHALQGEYKASMHRHRAAAAMLEDLHGPHHPGLTHALSNLARAHSALANAQPSLEAATRALANCEAGGGSERAHCMIHRQWLADLHLDHGRFERARSVYARSARVQERAGHRGSPERTWAAVSLARSHVARGDWSRAADWAKLGLRQTLSDDAANPGVIAQAYRAHALTELMLGQPEAALRSCHSALSRAIDSARYAMAEEPWIHRLIGQAHTARGDHERALHHLELALELERAHLRSRTNPNLAEHHLHLAEVFEALGHTNLAVEHARLALELHVEFLGPASHTTATYHHRLAAASLAHGDTDTALEHGLAAVLRFDPTQVLPARQAPYLLTLAKALEARAVSDERGTPESLALHARELFEKWPPDLARRRQAEVDAFLATLQST